MATIEIRESVQDDFPAIEQLYPEAFPDEDLLPVVRALLKEPAGVLSLVTIVESSLAAHVMFTSCGVTGGSENVALLAPLAVAPARQGQGLGRAIVEAGVQRLAKAGVTQVFVLGDPSYYGRLGFGPDADVAPPYALPPEWSEAWQSMSLNGSSPRPHGTLTVPTPWRDPALWAA